MSEDLIVIRTFASGLEADAVQAALQAAGIQSLLLTGAGGGATPFPPQLPPPQGIGLAVHRRDVERAEAALSSPPPDAT